jgi:eukaryotic-like serine/threonine-protein kinase
MACPAADEIEAFVARRLDAAANESVSAHLEGCADCRQLVLELGRAQRSQTPEEPDAPSMGSADALKSGATIGRYVPSRVLGVGGMGVVYAAWDPQLEREVAIKLLRPDSRVAADVLKARLMREAQAMARLSHPNVVTIYEVGAKDDQVFVVMELVDGGTLTQWLHAAPRSWSEIVRAFSAAGEGLSAAHTAGLVHRDFKPDNVLLRRDGRFGVTDFGLAREAALQESSTIESGELRQRFDERLTRTGAVVGTPAYMAPEQLESNRCDARSDLFSFCVSLYEALYGGRPFAGRNVEELRASLARGAAEPRAGAVPAWVTRHVMRGLHINPAERPASMRELIDALGRDPRQKLRRAGGAALVLSMIVLIMALVGDRLVTRRHRCDETAAPIAGRWNDAERAKIAGAFAKSGLPYAADTAGFVGRGLDAWAAAWRHERLDACEANQKHAQSAELYDLRMQCLDERLGELSAVVSELARGDKKSVDNAQGLVPPMGELERCRDEKYLRAVEPPPAMAKQLQPANDGLARAIVFCQDDRFDEAKREASAFSEGIPWAPLESQRLAVLAMVAMDAGELKEAEKQFYASIEAAERGRDDWNATRSWTLLSYVVGLLEGFHEEGLRIIKLAQAKGERIEGRPFLAKQLGYEAEFLRFVGRAKEAVPLVEQELALERKEGEVWEAKSLASYGNVLGMSGRLDEGLRAHRESLRIMEKLFGPNHPLTCIALENVAVDEWYLGHPEQALPLLDRVVAVREKVLQPGHPLTAAVLTNRAGTQVALGHWREAQADAARAVQILTTAIGATTPALIEPLNYAARARIGLGEPRPALALAERGLGIVERGDSDPSDAAIARYLVARALVETGGDRRRATTLFAAGITAMRKLANELGGQYLPRLHELETWQAQSPLRSNQAR